MINLDSQGISSSTIEHMFSSTGRILRLVWMYLVFFFFNLLFLNKKIKRAFCSNMVQWFYFTVMITLNSGVEVSIGKWGKRDNILENWQAARRFQMLLLCCVVTLSNSFETPWTVARQAPLSIEFPSKNSGVGCHFPQGTLPTQGSKWKIVARSREWRQDSWPLEERNSSRGQWRGLIVQSFCVTKYY